MKSLLSSLLFVGIAGLVPGCGGRQEEFDSKEDAIFVHTYNASADTYVMGNNSGGHGSEEGIVVSRYPSDNYRRIGFLTFNLAAGAIDTATLSLQLRYYTDNGVGSANINVYGIKDASTGCQEYFSESGLVYNSVPYANFAQADGINNTSACLTSSTPLVTLSVSASQVGQRLSVSSPALTAFLNANTSANASFVLTTDTLGPFISFASRESTTYTPPTLNVTHQATCSELQADLQDGALSGTYTGANLVQCDLSGVNLSYANLSGADLSGANLSHASLGHASLSYANLSGANLSCSNLSYANLSHADLNHADLNHAALSYASLNSVILKYADFSFPNLQNVDLSYADLSYANLTSAPLCAAAHLGGINVYRANLSGACLAGMHFVAGADFSGMNLSGASFDNGQFDYTNFSNANLSGAHIWGASFTGANLNGANLSGADVWQIYLNHASLSHANLSHDDFRYSQIMDADLSYADLSYANLIGTWLTGTNLTGAILTHALIW